MKISEFKSSKLQQSQFDHESFQFLDSNLENRIYEKSEIFMSDGHHSSIHFEMVHDQTPLIFIEIDSQT